MNFQESILTHLTQLLNVEDISLDDNLIEFGLSSIAMMQMVDVFVKNYRLTVKTSELMASPTIRSWARLLDTKHQNIQPEAKKTHSSHKVSVSSKNNTLNPLQRAYLVGRSAELPLGGFSMHDFREYRCNIPLDILTKKLYSMIERHDVLRTFIDEELVQQTLRNHMSNFETVDLSEFSKAEASIKLDTLRETYSHYVHDLSLSPWFIWFVRMPNAELTVFTSFDGLIIDGYGISVLLHELFHVETKEVSSKDIFVETQTTVTNYFDATQEDKDFWLEKINLVDGQIKLPWKKDLETITHPTYKRQSVMLKQALWEDITNHAAHNFLLANTVLTTVVLETLANWTSDDQVYLSVPISNSAQLHQVSNNSSFIMLAYTHDDKESFLIRAQKVQQDILESMSHTSFSGVELGKQLVKKLAITSPLPVAFTNGLSWQNISNKDVRYISGITQTPQLAMDIRASLSASKDLIIDIDYAEDALENTVVREILHAIKLRLEILATSNDFSKCEQIYLQNNQKKQSSVATDPIDIAPIAIDSLANYLDAIKSNLFVQTPKKNAIIFGTQSQLPQKVSYSMLGQHVANIMVSLKHHGIHDNDVVAICLPKNSEYIYNILACAMLGVIWVPIDIESPSERLHYLLTNCNATVVISNQSFDFIKTLHIDALLHTDSLDTGQDLIQHALRLCRYEISTQAAYYLYTSGSTGTPKCVVLNHAATANVMEATAAKWNITSDDVLMAVTPFHHDMSVFEVFMPIIVGATVVLPHETDTKNAMAWADLVQKNNVTIWSSVPAILDMLMACAMPEQLSSLRLVAQGGDFIKPHMIERLWSILPQARLFSLGGPTETTIWSIWHEIEPEDTDVIPYGKALPNNQYHIIKASGRPCPDYVVGTICTSGINVSNGYLKNGLLDTSELIDIETDHGVVKAFKTSDTGFFRDGNVIFSGRKAGYLKVRGVRIASAEVEKHIEQFESVKNIVVMACKEPNYQENELVAIYQTYDGNDIPTKEIKLFLQPYLPASHIPSRWIKIEDMPLTQNQKINRHALAKIANDAVCKNAFNDEPTPKNNPMETVVIESFSEVLNDNIELDRDILTLDVRLTHMMQISKKIHEKTDANISINDLLACKTVKDVSEKITQLS